MPSARLLASSLGISEIYTLDDFGSSDAWCGIIHTPAYVKDKDGERIIG